MNGGGTSPANIRYTEVANVPNSQRTLFSTWREWIATAASGLCATFNILNITDLATGAFGRNTAAISPGTKAVGYAASGLGLAVSPFVIYNESQMPKRKADLRETCAELNGQLERMKNENSELLKQIQRLEYRARTLKETRQALDKLALQQGSDLDTFIGQVAEFKSISGEKRNLMRASAVEDLVTLILICDEDENFQLEAGEIDELIIRLQVKGINFDEDSFRRDVTENGSVRFVLRRAKELIRPKAIEDVIALVDKCDANENQRIEGEEIDELVLLLRQIIRFDEEKLRKQIQDHGSIESVRQAVEGLLHLHGKNEKALLTMESCRECIDECMEESSPSFYTSIRVGVLASISRESLDRV